MAGKSSCRDSCYVRFFLQSLRLSTSFLFQFSSSSSCPPQQKFEALRSFLQNSVATLEANDFPTQTFVCDEQPYVRAQHAEKLLNDLSRAIEDNDLIFIDSDLGIRQSLRFDVVVEKATVATVDKNGVKRVAGQKIKVAQQYFRIGVTESIPYTYYKRNPQTHEIIRDATGAPIYEGFCIDLINELSRKLNFTFDIVEPSRGKFGKRQPDGSFDGLVGDLIRGETDFIAAALKMTAEREEYVDFVAPYFDQTGILIVMKKPTPDASLFKFMSVLRLEVWMSILGALSVTAVVIWLLEVFSPYSSRNWDYGERCR